MQLTYTDKLVCVLKIWDPELRIDLSFYHQWFSCLSCYSSLPRRLGWRCILGLSLWSYFSCTTSLMWISKCCSSLWLLSTSWSVLWWRWVWIHFVPSLSHNMTRPNQSIYKSVGSTSQVQGHHKLLAVLFWSSCSVWFSTQLRCIFLYSALIQIDLSALN